MYLKVLKKLVNLQYGLILLTFLFSFEDGRVNFRCDLQRGIHQDSTCPHSAQNTTKLQPDWGQVETSA